MNYSLKLNSYLYCYCVIVLFIATNTRENTLFGKLEEELGHEECWKNNIQET